MSNNGQNGFRAAANVGAAVVTVSRNAINDNGGDGISIVEGVTVAASGNVAHRNSGRGVFLSSAVASVNSALSANTFLGNIGGAIRVSGSGAVVDASANNTFSAQFSCDNGAHVITYNNNAAELISNFGCTIITIGLK